MKRHAPFLFLPLVLASCVGNPDPIAQAEPPAQSQAPAAPAPVAVTVRVPVPVKESTYYADGLLDRYISYEYDAGYARLLSMTTWDAGRGKAVERVAYEYSGGFPILETLTDGDGTVKYRKAMTPDPEGRTGEERTADGAGKPVSASRYAWDDEGRKLSWSLFDAAGVLKSFTAYEYEGNLLSRLSVTDGGGKTIVTCRLEYDERGRLARKAYFGPGGAPDRTETYRYEGENLVEYATFRADGSTEQRTVYEPGPAPTAPAKATIFDGRGKVRQIKAWEYAFREETTYVTK